MATIREIAEKAGVSTTTVSRVLNKDATLSITPKKKELIFEIAEEFNYRSPKNRRGLQSGKEPHKINVVCILLNSLEEELDDPYYLSIHHSIRAAANRRGILLDEIFYGSQSDLKRIARTADGVIVVGSAGSCDRRLAEEVLGKHRVPVCVDFDPGVGRSDIILADCRASIRELVNRFVQAGHRRIGYLGGREQGSPGSPAVLLDSRETMYAAALSEHGLFAEDIFISEGNYNHENGYRLMKRALEAKDRPTALYVSTDNMAVGAYKAAADCGLRIPDDIVLVGCNDQVGSAYMTPPLSSIRVNTALMGIAALGIVLDRIVEPRDVGLTISVPTALVLRRSFPAAHRSSVEKEIPAR